jgi:hypothetical protein
MESLYNDLLIQILIKCDVLSLLVLHFTTKKFRLLTSDNKTNRDLKTSFLMFLKVYENAIKEYVSPKNQLCKLVVKEGSLNILRWTQNICSWAKITGGIPNGTCAYAVKYNRLDMLIWMHQNGYPLDWDNGCPSDWDEFTCARAAINGNLDVLKYLHENGCPWDEHACAYAAIYGNLDVLKYLRENGCPWDDFTCLFAAQNNHLEVLIWAYENGCPINKNNCIITTQFRGHDKIVEWLKNNC